MDSITPPQSPDQPSPPAGPEPPEGGAHTTVTPDKKLHAKSKKRWLIMLAVGLPLLALIGFLIAAMLRGRSAPTVVKQDIPLLRYGTVEGPINSFYPGNSNAQTEFDVNEQIFEGLVTYENRTKIVPLLATSWTNPDDSTWIFDLKQGVKFHTGRTMTAKDVKYSLENFRDTNFGQLFGTTIKSVDILDDYKVQINTDGPDPVLLNKLTFLFIVDSQSDKQNDPVNGTGPYQMKSDTTPTEKELQLVAFDDYHGGHVYTRALTWLLYDDEEGMLEASKKGEVDFVGSFFKADKVRQLKELDLETYDIEGLAVSHIGINHSKTGSPVQKLKIRQAMYYAMDVPALLKAGDSRGNPASQIVPQDIPGYNPAVTRPARDLEKAKQLVKEAGYPGGVTLTLSYPVISENTIKEFVRQMAEANITVKLDPQPDTSSLIDKILNGQTEIYSVSYSTDILDAIDVFGFLGSFITPGSGKAEVDALTAKANTTLDPNERLKILQETSKVLMDNMAWVPISVPIYTWGLDKSYVIQRDMPQQGVGIFFWKVYSRG
jgi:peptide/nickel transport system substrate-binding protein